MTDLGFDNMINSNRLNRSFSQIFQAPIMLPHFGSRTKEDQVPEMEEDTMEKRLAKHLPKSRSSRKHRASRSTDHKGKGVTGDPSEDRSSGTGDTSHSSSSSSIDINMMEDSDKSQKNAFQTIRQAESKKVKSTRPVSPKPAGKPRAPELRRTKSLEGVALRSDRKQRPKTRKSTKMGNGSAPGHNTARSTGRNTDFRKSDSAKTMDPTNKKLRRNATKSGLNSKKSERRSPLQEYALELLRSPSPVHTRERRGSGKSSMDCSSKERRDSGKSNSDIKRKIPAHAIEPTPSTATTVTTTPTCIHVGHWTCDCGSVLRDRMNFCGLCGTPKHWTCEDCQFGENLCQFVFCGDCGVPREQSSRRSDSFPRVVSVYDRVEQD